MNWSRLIVILALLIGCGGKKASTEGSGNPSASATPSAVALDPDAAAKRGFELFDQEKADEVGAVKLWEPACAAGNDMACTGMGYAYAFGAGGKDTDYAKAKGLIEGPCERGNQKACSVLGQLHYYGWGVPKDIEKARPLWDKACKADLRRACLFLGLALSAPDGPPEWRDEEKGESLIRKACKLGHSDACDIVKKIDKKAEIDELRKTVRIKWWGDEKDAQCVGKGLPPFRKDYEGGTFDENEKVALHDGCKSPFQTRDDSIRNTFCCPHEKRK